ncbi:MAG: gas vesicle protein GvpD [Nanoarchaeota archaeon]|nr:gas vesicle protein GvpD [Nanoarchaeota archaeon]
MKKIKIRKKRKISTKRKPNLKVKLKKYFKIKPKKRVETKAKPAEKFMKTGIKGFDSLFEKNMGIPSGASVLVEGGPGSGKTIFCLAILNELCKQGKKGLYMSFEESEEQLIRHMEEFKWKPHEFIKKGILRVSRFDAIDVSRSIEALLSAAKKELLIEVEPMFFPEDFKPDFIVIDSLTSIASAFSGEESRFRIYMEQLFRYLEKNKITNFLVREVSSPSHVGTTFTEKGEAVSFLSDGIIVLYNIIYDSGERASAIEILKMRGASFKKRIVELKIINKKGIEINSKKILKRKKNSNFSLT